MRRISLAAVLIAGLAACGRGPAQGQAGGPYRDASLSIDRRVEDLLARMTPEEKFGQLFMVSGDLAGGEDAYKDGIFGLQFRAAGPGSRPKKPTPPRSSSSSNAPGHPRDILRGSSARPHPARRDVVPASDRFGGDMGRGPHGRGGRSGRRGDRESRHPPNPVPGRQPRPRCPLGPDRGDLRRRPGPGLAHGGRLRRGLREARRHRDAQALRRQRRRRGAGQLSYRRRRTRAPRDRAPALPHGGAGRRGPVDHVLLQFLGRPPRVGQRQAAQGSSQGRMGLQGLRHLGRERGGRDVQPAPHGGLLPRVGPAGLGERARRRLPSEIGHAALFGKRSRAASSPGPASTTPSGASSGPRWSSACSRIPMSIRPRRNGSAANRRTAPWPAKRPGIPWFSSRTTAAPCRSRGRQDRSRSSARTPSKRGSAATAGSAAARSPCLTPSGNGPRRRARPSVTPRAAAGSSRER